MKKKTQRSAGSGGRKRTRNARTRQTGRKVLLFDMRRITYDFLTIIPDVPGLLALAAFLETRGYDPLVFHGEPSSVREFLKQTRKQHPVLAVGFYCDFENQAEVMAMSREITEEHQIPVILGGPQVVGFDREYLRNAKCLAAVCGEGEIVLAGILDSLSGGGKDWRELDGVVYVDDKNEVVKNPAAEAIKNLDQLPPPAFHLWVNRPTQSNMQYVLSGRGCPFRCAFCYEGSSMRTLRLRSVAGVLQEVANILDSQPHVNYITFIDDTFTISPKRIHEFCEGLSRLQDKREFAWYCEGHVKLLSRHPELLSKMVKAGLIRLQIGIESGVQEILNAYGKNITLQEIETVVRTGAEVGLHQIVGFFLFGGPFENETVLEKNKEFAERLIEAAPGVIGLGPSALMLYPDTAITRCPEQYGLRVREHNGITTLADYPVTETDTVSRERIARNQQEFVRHVFRTMKRVYREGKVPHRRILDCFTDSRRYRVSSVWEATVYHEEPFLEGYYSLLARGAVSRSCDIPRSEIKSWRPQRVFEMWHDMDFSEGFPKLGDEVLSPLEFELILYSTGKLTLGEVLKKVYEKFGARFKTRNEFEKTARKVLASFEDKHQLAYGRL